jgi:hypothetical protein
LTIEASLKQHYGILATKINMVLDNIDHIEAPPAGVLHSPISRPELKFRADSESPLKVD